MLIRGTRLWGAALVATALLATGAVPVTGSGSPPSALVAVVVRGPSVEAAAAAVNDGGGTVERRLELIGGVAAELSAAAAADLHGAPGFEVTSDQALHFASLDTAPAATDHVQLAALNPGDGWSTETGSGVGVALLDTGIADHPDLAGRVVVGPDYSGEGDGLDRYGHGTFMAGLIAGDGTPSAGMSTRHGVAPGAHIVSVKLAGADGVTSLSRVLDAIGWVVVNQDEYGIRVLNLSIGVPTNVAPQADPLSAAVQAAWASGLTVVAAAGNEGNGVVTSPGRDPWVITVGATDTNGTASTADDTVPGWSGNGRVTSNEKPELLAPGVSVVSLRVPGSRIDERHPEARVDDAYFRGSGTSMSTALVSGAVAALAELRPAATPDDLKGALVSTGGALDGTLGRTVDLSAADAAEPSPAWRQRHPVAGGHESVLRNGMPWSASTSPPSEVTWSRARWAVDGWVREGFARARWADAEFVRARWAVTAFARARWAETNLARARWADANFTRARWAEGQWARARWAIAADDEAWVRARWAARWLAPTAP